MLDSCIFCKITAGEIPSNTIYEDDTFQAILDIAPAAKGHTVLLVKQHTPNLFETEDSILSKALPVAKKIAIALKKALSCDGVNILQNNGTSAGQSIFHLHIHIIPRYEEDGLVIPWHTKTYADGEAKLLAEKIKEHIL